MPSIKYVSKTETYQDMVTESFSEKEKNDCAVKALAITCCVTYKVAREALAEQGRKPGKGTDNLHLRSAIEALGKKAIARPVRGFINNYPSPHNNLKGVTTHHPDRFNSVWADGKSYLFFKKGHVLAVVNGTNHDFTRGRAFHVHTIWEVV
jgi:hypothetical protein